MSTNPPPIGIDHPTVVPTNSDDDERTESGGNVSANNSLAPQNKGRDES